MRRFFLISIALLTAACIGLIACCAVFLVAGAALGIYPTPTPTPAPTATITLTLSITPTASDTPRPLDTPTSTTSFTPRPTRTPLPPTLVPFASDILQLNGVKSVIHAEISPLDNGFYAYVEICTETGKNTPQMADLIRRLSYEQARSAVVEFSAILDDGEMAITYDWDNAADSWRITEMSLTASECR